MARIRSDSEEDSLQFISETRLSRYATSIASWFEKPNEEDTPFSSRTSTDFQTLQSLKKYNNSSNKNASEKDAENTAQNIRNNNNLTENNLKQNETTTDLISSTQNLDLTNLEQFRINAIESIIERNSFYPPTARAVCKYNEKCFRNLPAHFEEFSHPLTHTYVKNWLNKKTNPSSPRNTVDESVEPNNNNNNEPDVLHKSADNKAGKSNLKSNVSKWYSNVVNTFKHSNDQDTPKEKHKRRSQKGERDTKYVEPSPRYQEKQPDTSDQEESKGSHYRRSLDLYELSHKLATSNNSTYDVASTELPSNYATKAHLLVSSPDAKSENYKDSTDLRGAFSHEEEHSSQYQDNVTDERLEEMSPAQLRQLIKKLQASKPKHQKSSSSSDPLSLQELNTWNESFQQAVQGVRELSPNTKQSQRKDVYHAISYLGRNFISEATKYAKIIISEVYLSPEKMTIKPLKGKGFAGGSKYFVRGIYFKFAVDSANLYGSDESAMKVAGHELRHLIQVFNCWPKSIHVPMSVLVDYRGFRLIAMTSLPINDETIVYGSNDASKALTFHMSNDQITKMVENLTKELNLKPHSIDASGVAFPPPVGYKPGPNGVKIRAPVDLEAHLGLDDQIYLLDFSRLFPPVFPDPKIPCSYLVNLFRPEFVVNYPKPLCSDAFSLFISNTENYAEHNQEIKEATDYLLKKLVPKFAVTLTKLSPDECNHFPLIESVHISRINIKYLGIIRSCLATQASYWKLTLLIEMIARTIKQSVRTKLREKTRELAQPGDEAYKRLVIDHLNLIFGDRPQSYTFWNSILKLQVAAKYQQSLTEEELLRQDSLPSLLESLGASSEQDPRCLLFSRVCDMLGLVFSSNVQRAMVDPTIFQFQFPFDEIDLIEIKEKVKHMNIVSHAEGFVLKIKASRKRGEESKRLYRLAIDCFKKALSIDPSNKHSMRNLADCYLHTDCFQEAKFYYHRAIEMDPNDTNSLFKYACFLDTYQEYDEAEKFYLRALTADPYHSNALCVYADFLVYVRRNFEFAEQLYACASQTERQNPFLLNNYACLLMRGKKFEQAETYLRQAMKCDSDNPTIHKNLSICLSKMNKHEEAKHHLQLANEKSTNVLTKSGSGADLNLLESQTRL